MTLIFVAVIAALVLDIWIYGYLNLPYFFNLSTLLSLWVIVMWKKYHESISIFIAVVSIVGSNILFLLSLHYFGIVLNLVFILYMLLKKTDYLLDKFFGDMKFVYSANAAAANKDFGAMLIIANANRTKKKYRFTFPENTDFPLFTKAFLIDTVRSSSPVWIICGVVFIVAIIMLYVPFLKGYGIYLSAIALSDCARLIAKENVNYLELLLRKSKLGLFIPYSEKRVLMAHLVLPVIETIIPFTVGMIIFKTPLIRVILAFFLSSMVILLWMFTTYRMVKYKKTRAAICSILIALSVISLVF